MNNNNNIANWMALFRGIQEYIALDANNITLVFDSGNIVNISGNIFLYPPQGHPILYKYYTTTNTKTILCPIKIVYLRRFPFKAAFTDSSGNKCRKNHHNNFICL